MPTDNRIALEVALEVALVYDRDCPNVGDCRDALRSALSEFGARPSWSEWDRNSADTPTAYRSFGSPTVLVNGRDIYSATQDSEPEGNSCRVYANDESGRLAGVPSVKSIVNALFAAAADGPVAHGATHADLRAGLNADGTGVGCVC